MNDNTKKLVNAIRNDKMYDAKQYLSNIIDKKLVEKKQEIQYDIDNKTN